MTYFWHSLLALMIFVSPAIGENAAITELKHASVGKNYHASLGLHPPGVFPFRLAVTAGSLPPGLTLKQDGTIDGTGDSIADQVFVVTITDDAGASEQVSFHLKVEGEPESAGSGQSNDSSTLQDSANASKTKCPDESAVQPRITSHLTEGTSTINGIAEATKTGCNTKVRLWLVPKGASSDILSLNSDVEELPMRQEDGNVTAQGTWTVELQHPLDSGQYVQVEQYFEGAGDPQNQKSSAAGDQAAPKANQEINIFSAAAKQLKISTWMAGRATREDIRSYGKDEGKPKCAVAMTQDDGTPLPADQLKPMCSKLNQLRSQYLSVPQTVQGVADWGRAKAYFTSGVLLAHDQGSFSNSSLFLSFNLDKNLLLPEHFITEDKDKRGFSPGFNTFFETRLTSVPVTTCTTSSTGSGSGSGTGATSGQASQCQSQSQSQMASLDTFITSRKTARLEAGMYLPMLITTWHYQAARNAFYWAPLAKVGFDTPTESFNANTAGSQAQAQSGTSTAATASLVNNGRFYVNYSAGFRLGHYRLSSSRNQAPEDISHLDVTLGRFGNLESLVQPGGPNGPIGRQRLWRFQFEGLLKIPNTPATVGFSANVGQEVIGASKVFKPAQDDLRFLFGTKLDVGKLLSRLKGF